MALGVCQLIADPRNKFTYVPPPVMPSSPRSHGRSGLFAQTVAVNVTYVNFTTQQQAAFQYAVDIWKTQVVSPVPIEVYAEMKPLTPDLLGRVGATYVERNGTWYPKALVNKIEGTNVQPAYRDIVVEQNLFFNWYYGTDGHPGLGQYDFVTAVLHELGHGMGIVGSLESNGSVGTWVDSDVAYPGFAVTPGIYDWFTEASGTPLLWFSTPSTALHTALTGNSVFWNGGNALAANGGVKPRLYAPNPFRSGSSYSHVDEATYPAGSINSLMTPNLGAVEAIHDPGPIVRGMLTDEGWATSAACAFSVSPASVLFGAAGGSGSINLITTVGCAWTATSNSAAVSITSGDSGSSSGTVSYSVTPNTLGARTLTMTVAGQTVTVSQASGLPTLTLDRTTLRFNAVRGSVMTPAQTVTVGQTGGTGILSWTASSNASWLQVVPTAGSGAGLLTIQLNPSDPTLQAFGTYTGRITVVGAGSNTIAIDVTMTVSAPGSTTVPFGQVDTPVQHATGVQGAIGVTGWALDDVAVGSVKIYRNCLAFDPAGACGVINGVNLVYIGDAAFVPGARADLEAAFSTYPQAHRAGWGYLMLTNMLPDVPGGLGFGGQGNLTIYAFATDAEGNRRLLGRAWHFTEPGATDATQITMANASIAKPFGAIDTPGQGQTVSGMLANFGWALTPDGNTIADAGDILIATNGSTMNVVIDGAAVGTVQYNQCRGSVGNPVPAGVFCDDDVASIFGHLTPQPGLTPRTSNPTRFRNLDAGRAVIGAFDIDTRTLPNGRHSIAWGVLDSAGRAEGIGSRDFIVLNGAALRAGDQTASIDDAAAMNLGDATEVSARPLSAVTVWGRTGFDFTRPVDEVRPHSTTGMRHVRIPELGRLELWLGEGVTAGYLVANGQLRALPPGSWLDVASGRFTWGPLVGYIGPYDLVFLDGEAQIPVRVTLEPKTSETAGLLRGYIDLPAPQATGSGPLTVAGWALDTGGWQGSGVGAVHVWAHRVDMAAAPAVFLGAAELGVVRPDVAAAFGAYAERAGWQLVAPGLAPGIYDVVAYFWSTRTARFEDARTVRITVR